jgi:diguanylate cyclase (GGDEF)-like protein
MLAGSKHRSPGRTCRALFAALCLVSSLALSQSQPSPLDQRLQELRETSRLVPERALVELEQLEAQGRAAPQPARVEFLTIFSHARRNLGQLPQADALAEEVIAIGKATNDKVALAKGMLAKAYVVFKQNDLKTAHQLVWDAEKIANTTGDYPLRIQAAINSGESFAEEGDLPNGMIKTQGAATLARQYGDPTEILKALHAMASLHYLMKQYDMGFEVLAEATRYAEQINSPGRLAAIKRREYGLAMETNQPERALRALLEALALYRKIGAQTMIGSTLVDLSDSYLKRHDYVRCLSYGQQALDVALKQDNQLNAATARVNIGQAYLGLGKIADGKRQFDAGLAFYDKQGDKPELQAVLAEYGAALERAGDMAGAVKAYHRERALSNELFEKQRQKSMWELQEKYDTEAKQRQIELLSRENLIKSTELDNRRLQQRIWWLLAVVFALASVIVGALYRKVRSANAKLEEKNLELKAQSSLDPLTSLYNRRHFQEFMRNHQQVEKRGAGTSGEEIVGALFLLDVDHFKHVNDTYGHAAGDAVLKMIAENLRVILRETDMIVRWGGEEFLAFLPAIPRSGLEEVARRLLTGISAHTIDYQDSKISVNVSIGFAPFPLVPGAHPLPWERAVNLVDMALYLAKAHGRNRAYGVRGFANFEQTSMENIEQDLERAWRAGFVDLSIVLGGWPEPKSEPAPPVKLTLV